MALLESRRFGFNETGYGSQHGWVWCCVSGWMCWNRWKSPARWIKKANKCMWLVLILVSQGHKCCSAGYVAPKWNKGWLGGRRFWKSTFSDSNPEANSVGRSLTAFIVSPIHSPSRHWHPFAYMRGGVHVTKAVLSYQSIRNPFRFTELHRGTTFAFGNGFRTFLPS